MPFTPLPADAQLDAPKLAPLPPSAKLDSAPAPEEYTGEILPFRRDASGLHLAVPEMIASPVRGMVEGGKRMLGIGEKGQDPSRPLSPDTMAAVTSFAGSPIAGAEIGRGIADPASLAANAAERAAAKTENQARAAISTQFEKGTKAGAPTAADAIVELHKARAEGQSLVLADVNNAPLGQLAGTTYRQGGAARQVMKSFLDTRGVDASARVEDVINRHLSDESFRGTAKQLAETRSANSRPIWDDARKGGSLAPLEHQFQTAFNEAGQREVAARQAATVAANMLTQAKAKAATAGNAYSSSAASRESVAAEHMAQAAMDNLTRIQKVKADALDRLRQAQADGSANAPGAVWSPRLQEFLDQPEVQRGINKGYAIERRRAVGQGKPFNPSEYAVVGETKEGEPIVGKVPNMSLLMVAKEGLDAAIEDMKDPLTGRPTKEGLSYIELRNGLVSELDRLNPLYKQAREMWAGDTLTIRALQDGRNFLSAQKFSPEDLAEHIGQMSDSERQFFTIGVADALKNKLFRASDTGNKGAAVINTEDARMRLRPLFGSDDASQQFIDTIERERAMARTAGRTYGGSATGERVADDKIAEAMVHAAHGVMQLLEGRWVSSVANAIRVRRMFGGQVNPELSEAVARALTDPNADLSAIGPLLPPKAVPKKLPELPRRGAVGAATKAIPGIMSGNQNPADAMIGQIP